MSRMFIIMFRTFRKKEMPNRHLRLMTTPFPKMGFVFFPQPPENRGNYSFNTTKKIIIWCHCPILLQEKMSVDFVNALRCRIGIFFNSSKTRNPYPSASGSFLGSVCTTEAVCLRLLKNLSLSFGNIPKGSEDGPENLENRWFWDPTRPTRRPPPFLEIFEIPTSPGLRPIRSKAGFQFP